MTSRSSRFAGRRKHVPFVKLSLHQRRDLVVRLSGRIAQAGQTQALSGFWTDHLLVDPDDPQRFRDEGEQDWCAVKTV